MVHSIGALGAAVEHCLSRIEFQAPQSDARRVVLPTLKVRKGRIRVSYAATHRSR
ncbi:hypothetical protein [Streptomyces sp. NBC_01262]|uniref:hypothetical protein n=1 Tax=Streptomyces sp. NBC_01262 TaxID=2903803 RepID=UPI002E31112D|nr:hypothetical protein [Streptomyces sp. NBC_01262]